MQIDGKDAERIAKELIGEIASEWKDTPDVRCLENNGSYLFEFVLQPSHVYRYGHRVERAVALSTFRFDPLAEAVEIVIECAFLTEPPPDLLSSDASLVDSFTDSVIRLNSKPRIVQMLEVAPTVFSDAMWQARIIGETLQGLGHMQMVGRPDIARGLLNSTIRLIEGKLRERFGDIPQKQKPKINRFKLTTTLAAFLQQFKETGQIPSQRKFATALGVTAKGWRDYLDRHHLGKHDEFVRRELEELSRRLLGENR